MERTQKRKEETHAKNGRNRKRKVKISGRKGLWMKLMRRFLSNGCHFVRQNVRLLRYGINNDHWIGGMGMESIHFMSLILNGIPHFEISHFLQCYCIGDIKQLSHIFLTFLLPITTSIIATSQFLGTLFNADEFPFILQKKYLNRIVQTQRWLQAFSNNKCISNK